MIRHNRFSPSLSAPHCHAHWTDHYFIFQS